MTQRIPGASPPHPDGKPNFPNIRPGQFVAIGEIVGHLVLPEFHGPGRVLDLYCPPGYDESNANRLEYLVYFYRSKYFLWMMRSHLYRPRDYVATNWSEEILRERMQDGQRIRRRSSVVVPAAGVDDR